MVEFGALATPGVPKAAEIKTPTKFFASSPAGGSGFSRASAHVKLVNCDAHDTSP